MNVALHKTIFETKDWKNSEAITDGNITGQYTYGEVANPNYCTLDLKQVYEIAIIRILLYDRDTRNYKYRLLTSVDNQTWEVHIDTNSSSWQNFEFFEKLKMRYIRVHCLANSKNAAFHIGQVEAYENKIALNPAEVHNLINATSKNIEINDGISISNKLIPLVKTIREVPERFHGLDKAYFAEIASELETRILDVEKIEKGMEAIRRQIIEPVNRELFSSNKIGRWSIILGIVGGILSIISLLNTLFKWWV